MYSREKEATKLFTLEKEDHIFGIEILNILFNISFDGYFKSF